MKVLIAPLNWGLGHATRDIPIIRQFEEQGAEIILASDGKAYDLLRSEFPNHKLYKLPGWNVTYPEKGNFARHLFFQGFKVFMAIKREHRALEKLVKQEKIDVVISDNRLGCYSKKAFSVIVTHQVFLQSPIIETLLNRYNQHALKRFDECWVVDYPGENNLSGKLSHARTIPFNHKYIGLLSRFNKIQVGPGEKIDVLAIISGPEPQRTLFEKEILPQLEDMPVKSVALLGKPGEGDAVERRGNLTIYQHLNSVEIEKLINRAEVVVSRDGYTTVMDLVLLGKKAILVPTPGQTEQEYLAGLYEERKWYVMQRQGNIDLREALEKVKSCTLPYLPQTDYLGRAIAEITKLRK